MMEVARRLIWNYADLRDFFVEVCSEPPTETRDDISISGEYPFLCIIAEDEDNDFHSFNVYPDEFVGSIDA